MTCHVDNPTDTDSKTHLHVSIISHSTSNEIRFNMKHLYEIIHAVTVNNNNDIRRHLSPYSHVLCLLMEPIALTIIIYIQ